MNIDEILEFEYYEAEYGDGDVVDPHCTITGIKAVDRLPPDLDIPFRTTYDYCDYFITVIEDEIFKGIKNLRSVVLRGSLQEIGVRAFAYCDGLKSVTISSLIEYVFFDAFLGCDNIERVQIDDIGEQCRISFGSKYSNPMTFAKQIFIDDAPLGDVLEIPEKSGTFNKVRSIGKYAFVGCKIKTLKFEEGIEEMRIDPEAFCDCDLLTDVILPDSLTTFDPTGLLSCPNIKYNEYNGLKYFGSVSNPYKALVGIADDVVSAVPHPDTEIICGCAFKNGKRLKSLLFPPKLKTIMQKAFDGCDNITTVTLSEDVTSIDTSKLSICRNIKYVELNGLRYLQSETNPYKALVGVTQQAKAYTIHPHTEIIGNDAFKNSVELTELTIPEGVKYIGKNAFFNCSNMQRIYLPSTLARIGSNAFSYCDALEEVHIPNAGAWCNIELDIDINERKNTNPISRADLYLGNEKAENVIVPQGVETIRSYAFARCKTIKRVTLPEGLKQIELEAFAECSNLEQINIPNSVEIICALAFNYCTSLKEITMYGVKEIGFSAFHNCTALERVSFSATLEKISRSAFEYCTSLKSIDLPYGVRSIGEQAFRDCTSLTQAIIPESVDIISHSAFQDCKSLRSVTLPDAVTVFGTCAFEGCRSLKSVRIPAVECIDRAAFKGCYELESAYISAGTKYIGTESFEDCKSLAHVEIVEGVTRINSRAFRDCYALRSLELPASLKVISGSAFFASGIRELKLPDGVELFSEAFMYMGALKRIEIPDTVTEIGRDIFRGCDNELEIIASDKVKALIFKK